MHRARHRPDRRRPAGHLCMTQCAVVRARKVAHFDAFTLSIHFVQYEELFCRVMRFISSHSTQLFQKSSAVPVGPEPLRVTASVRVHVAGFMIACRCASGACGLVSGREGPYPRLAVEGRSTTATRAACSTSPMSPRRPSEAPVRSAGCSAHGGWPMAACPASRLGSSEPGDTTRLRL